MGAQLAAALPDAPGQDTLLICSFMFNPDSAGRPLRVTWPLCTSMLGSRCSADHPGGRAPDWYPSLSY